MLVSILRNDLEHRHLEGSSNNNTVSLLNKSIFIQTTGIQNEKEKKCGEK